MSLYQFTRIDFSTSRVELHDSLSLTGTEVSYNQLPAGTSVPFVHKHNQNEEIYIVLDGEGKLYLDGEERLLQAGDCFRVDPTVERCLSATEDRSLRFLCIQAKAGSLDGYTMSDALLTDSKPSWL